MNILVVGAGAVGGYFGGRLAVAGERVTMVCRGRTREAIERDGLRIESISGNASARPRCVDRPDGPEKADLILWTVKTYHNADAILLMRSAVGAGTTVLSLQNGVDAVDELSDAFGKEHVLGGYVNIAAEAIAPGVIRHTSMGRIVFAELDGGETERTQTIAALFERAGIPHKRSENIRRDLWGKLVWNAAFNPLSVLLKATVEEMLTNLSALSILKRAMDEVIRVAAAEGHAISNKVVESYLDIKDQTGEFHTSMLQDFVRGRPMEADAISGAVVRRAKKHGISAPVNELFYDLLRCLEERAPR